MAISQSGTDIRSLRSEPWKYSWIAGKPTCSQIEQYPCQRHDFPERVAQCNRHRKSEPLVREQAILRPLIEKKAQAIKAEPDPDRRAELRTAVTTALAGRPTKQ